MCPPKRLGAAVMLAFALVPALAFAPAPALAQRSVPDPGSHASPATPTTGRTATPTATPPEPLPPPQPAANPGPPVPPPALAERGGPRVDDAAAAALGYAQVGVLELGGSAGLSLAQDIRAVNFSPSIGRFLSDHFELSAILDVTNLKVGEHSATLWSALAEPSFHFPFESPVFGFVGMGLGVAYVDELGAAMAVAPRLGIDVLIGRTGILRPSLSYVYTTHDATNGTDANGNTDVTLVAISSALRFNIGYLKTW